MDCCKVTKRHKTCRRRSDGKIFKLPRRFTRKGCKRVRGFSMISSCAPYNDCFQGGKHKSTAYIDMNGITDKIHFSSYNKTCKIKYSIYGIPNGKHGFHIHRCGDLTKGCKGGVTISIQPTPLMVVYILQIDMLEIWETSMQKTTKPLVNNSTRLIMRYIVYIFYYRSYDHYRDNRY